MIVKNICRKANGLFFFFWKTEKRLFTIIIAITSQIKENAIEPNKMESLQNSNESKKMYGETNGLFFF